MACLADVFWWVGVCIGKRIQSELGDYDFSIRK